MRVHKTAFAAEITANHGGVHTHLGFGLVNAIGQLLAHLKWHFAIDPKLDTIVVIDLHHASVWLHIALVLSLGAKGMFKDEGRVGKSLLDITIFPDGVGGDIRMLLRPFYPTFIGHKLRMQSRGIRLHRLHRIVHCWQFFILHVDQAQGRFRNICVICGYCDHFLSGEAYDIAGQHRDVAQKPTHERLWDIRAG